MERLDGNCKTCKISLYYEHNFQEMVDVGEDFLQEMRNIKDVCRDATNNFLGMTWPLLLSTFDCVSQIEMQAGLEETPTDGAGNAGLCSGLASMPCMRGQTARRNPPTVLACGFLCLVHAAWLFKSECLFHVSIQDPG